MGKLRYSHSAEQDLLEAWLYIAADNPTAADHVLDSIEREAVLLSEQPRMGRERPELAPGIRSWPTSTRYVLFYVIDGEGISIARVLHHARDTAATEDWGSR
jgi:toxin ParE1/3/4